MQLLANKTFENEDVRKITGLIENWLIEGREKDNFNFSKLITYQEFKDSINNFLLSIMKLLLENYQYKDDQCTVVIKSMPKKNGGKFLDSKEFGNVLTINEQEIKDIYDGNVDKFIVLFHELNHFKVKYDIMQGVISEDIVRIVKERLIRKTTQDPFEEIESIKKPILYVNDDYYCDNYYIYSEEIYVQLQALKDFSLMIGSLAENIDDQREIISLIQSEYKNDFEKLMKWYDNHKRNFTSSFYFNSNYLNFEDAFDLLVTDNPDWLNYPQIRIEYYIDENNKVKKRTVEQLLELLNSSNFPEEQTYINTLINNYSKNQNNKKI